MSLEERQSRIRLGHTTPYDRQRPNGGFPIVAAAATGPPQQLLRVRRSSYGSAAAASDHAGSEEKSDHRPGGPATPVIRENSHLEYLGLSAPVSPGGRLSDTAPSG
jgi:hypothetical protein